MIMEIDLITLFESPIVRQRFNAEARDRGIKIAVYEINDDYSAIIDQSQVPHYGSVDATELVSVPNSDTEFVDPDR